MGMRTISMGNINGKKKKKKEFVTHSDLYFSRYYEVMPLSETSHLESIFTDLTMHTIYPAAEPQVFLCFISGGILLKCY